MLNFKDVNLWTLKKLFTMPPHPKQFTVLTDL